MVIVIFFHYKNQLEDSPSSFDSGDIHSSSAIINIFTFVIVTLFLRKRRNPYTFYDKNYKFLIEFITIILK